MQPVSMLRVLLSALIPIVIPATAGAQAVHYVDASASGGNDGTSWGDAFVDLQDALAAAVSTDEVWVAAGAYRPDGGTGDRAMSFDLVNGVGLYGGFAGWETERGQRNPSGNLTVLSGDLAEDDEADFVNYEENSFHVVTGDGLYGSTVLDGFTITGGNADDEDERSGGGLMATWANVRVVRCVFEGNLAIEGGGMLLFGYDTATVHDCLFYGNDASQGGAVLDFRFGDAVASFSRCTFLHNAASNVGGAVYRVNHSSDGGGGCSFMDCFFAGNTAADEGGGVGDWGSDRPIYVNCAFTGNVAGGPGGAYYMIGEARRIRFTNCSFSGNQADMGGGLFVYRCWPGFTNCVLWGNQDSGGTGESAQIWVEDGHARLDYSCVQGWIGQLDGEHTIDQGPDFADPHGQDGVLGTADDDLRLLPGSPCIDAGDNEVDTDLSGPNQPDYLPNRDLDGGSRFSAYPPVEDTGNGVAPFVDMGAYEFQDCNTNGAPDPQDIADETSEDVEGNGIPDECQTVWLVDDDATGANDGASWADAFVDLQDALASAGFGDRVHVAEGTYRPDRGTGERSASFELRRGVWLSGGFAGRAADDQQRDPARNAAILSGDLAGNDGPNFTNYDENSYHVVKSIGVDALSVLDGFVITAGNADDRSDAHYGAGLFNSNASPTITGCCFHRNQARVGGAMYNDGGSLTLNRCLIEQNQAHYGGALFDGQAVGESQFVDCTFIRNAALREGGALVVAAGYNDEPAAVKLIRCRFVSNTAGWEGGGVLAVFVDLSLQNCLFHGNEAAEEGGGVALVEMVGTPMVLNCTFSENSAATGGGISCQRETFPGIRNSIFWGNSDDSGDGEAAQINLADGNLTIDYSCVQGWTGAFGGVGNLGSNPRLRRDGLHLAIRSPCWNAGDPDFVPLPDQTDLDDQPRVLDGRLDMGADEVLLEFEIPLMLEPV